MRAYFSSQPVFYQSIKTIDRENGIIRGVTVVKCGNAKGRDYKIDRKFLQQIVDQASERPQGIKARFGHPNMCSTALGTYLGRFKNYSYHGDFVKADLHLDTTAKKAPSGNLFDYVVDMAESSPDMFGASIAFQTDEFEEVEVEVDGKKNKELYFRLKELHATDIVDDPAATDGLFSSDSLPAQTTQFLDENPQLSEFIFSKPERVIEFLNNYLTNSNMSLTDQIKSKFRQLFNLDADIKKLSVSVSDEGEPAPIVDDTHGNPDPEPASFSSAPPVPPVPEPVEGELAEGVEAVEGVVPDPPVAEPVEAVEGVEGLQTLIDTAFESFLEANPDPSIQPDSEGNLLHIDEELPEKTYAFDAGTKLIYMLHSHTTIKEQLSAAMQQIQELGNQISDLTDRLNARPTIPKEVTDPLVNVHTDPVLTDDTGKQIMSNIPPDLKYKLKAK
jgi:hypothetical protein